MNVRNDLEPALLRTLDRLDVGETSDIVRTSRGYEIVKLESQTGIEVLPFDLVRGGIVEKIGSGRRQAALDAYLETLRARAKIEWKDETLERLYEQAMRGNPLQTP